jgi:transposase
MIAPQPAVAGIDVSKATLDIVILPSGKRLMAGNHPDGINRLIRQLIEAQVAKVVLEATGGLEYPCARSLADAGIAVNRVNPERIFGFRKSLGRRAKTDLLDAELIARFALVMDEPARPLPSIQAQNLKDLAARRRQLVEMIAMEKNRLKRSIDLGLTQSVKTIIAALAAERTRIEGLINNAIAAEAEANRRYDILTSIPGFGPVVATTIVTEMPEIGQVDRRAAASLAGVAPHPEQSGTSLNRTNLHSGRPCLRTALYMAALAAARANPEMKAFKAQLVANGKAPKQAIIAVARKLITLANQLVRENRNWTPKDQLPT